MGKRLCECGITREVMAKLLRTGLTKRCGCLQKEIGAKIRTRDLTNQRFGRLVALRPTEEKRLEVIWLCKSDCGEICRVPSNLLVTHHKKKTAVAY